MYLVGGAVRDLLLGGAPIDLDLAVEGDAASFAASLGGDPRVHDRFGTSTVTLDGFTYDIARDPPRDVRASRARSPTWSPRALAEDLNRRDFTVNAIALALAGDTAGELTSAPARSTISTRAGCGSSTTRSFIDDPTRLLRLARYAGRLASRSSRTPRALAETRSSSGALGTVSGPRVGTELRLLARERGSRRGRSAGLRDIGLDIAIAPGFGARRRGPRAPGAGAAARPTGDRTGLALGGGRPGVPGRRAGRAA